MGLRNFNIPVFGERDGCDRSRMSREICYICTFLQIPNLDNTINIKLIFH